MSGGDSLAATLSDSCCLISRLVGPFSSRKKKQFLKFTDEIQKKKALYCDLAQCAYQWVSCSCQKRDYLATHTLGIGYLSSSALTQEPVYTTEKRRTRRALYSHESYILRLRGWEIHGLAKAGDGAIPTGGLTPQLVVFAPYT